MPNDRRTPSRAPSCVDAHTSRSSSSDSTALIDLQRLLVLRAVVEGGLAVEGTNDGIGIGPSIALATGLIRSAGITLPGNGSRTMAPLTVRVVSGSKITTGWPFAFRVCEKSPARSRAVGSVNTLLRVLRCL